MTRIYVDLDDVLAQTGRMFLRVLRERFGREVEFEDLQSYHLGETLGLDEAALAEFLRATHEPEELLSIEPMPGAAEALAHWARRGREVLVVTGRPPETRAPTLAWLERAGLAYSEFHFLDKYSEYYGGAHGTPDGVWGLADLDGLDLRLAVEDFPGTAEYLAGRTVPVALFDRPWNRAMGETASAGVVRCRGWGEILERFAEL